MIFFTACAVLKIYHTFPDLRMEIQIKYKLRSICVQTSETLCCGFASMTSLSF